MTLARNDLFLVPLFRRTCAGVIFIAIPGAVAVNVFI